MYALHLIIKKKVILFDIISVHLYGLPIIIVFFLF